MKWWQWVSSLAESSFVLFPITKTKCVKYVFLFFYYQFWFFCFAGKDDKAWSMYIDYQRSWFIHMDEHTNRTDGGIKRSTVIGCLLDLGHHTLSYYIDDEPHGPIAFTDLHGVFFPAVSINRNVQVSLRTGLEPPVDSGSEEEWSASSAGTAVGRCVWELWVSTARGERIKFVVMEWTYRSKGWCQNHVYDYEIRINKIDRFT